MAGVHERPTNVVPRHPKDGSSFSLSSLLEHDQFASIKANLKKNTTWKSTNNLDISRFVEGQSKLFDVMEEPNFRRLDENSLTGEELREDLKSVFRILSADRDELIENLSEIIRFCSRTDTKELSDNKNLIAVVFERHGVTKNHGTSSQSTSISKIELIHLLGVNTLIPPQKRTERKGQHLI